MHSKIKSAKHVRWVTAEAGGCDDGRNDRSQLEAVFQSLVTYPNLFSFGNLMWGTQLIDSPMPFISTATGERITSYQEPCISIRGQEWDWVLVDIS